MYKWNLLYSNFVENKFFKSVIKARSKQEATNKAIKLVKNKLNIDDNFLNNYNLRLQTL